MHLETSWWLTGENKKKNHQHAVRNVMVLADTDQREAAAWPLMNPSVWQLLTSCLRPQQRKAGAVTRGLAVKWPEPVVLHKHTHTHTKLPIWNSTKWRLHRSLLSSVLSQLETHISAVIIIRSLLQMDVSDECISDACDKHKQQFCFVVVWRNWHFPHLEISACQSEWKIYFHTVNL